MTPKFTAGQRLIHYGKEVEVLEVIEDTFGSLNQYRLKATDGSEFEAYENTLSLIKDKTENIVCPVVEKAKELRATVNKPIARERHIDDPPDDAIPRIVDPDNKTVRVNNDGALQVEITNTQDLLDLFKRPEPAPRRPIVDANRVRSALRSGKLEDLMKLFDE